MTVTQQQLGERIRVAREQFHLTREQLAEFAKLPAEDIRRIEEAAQPVSSIHFSRIAYAVGRGRGDFFAATFPDARLSASLFKRSPLEADDGEAIGVLQRAIALALQQASLEQMIGIERSPPTVSTMALPEPLDIGMATAQGEAKARAERLRLGLDDEGAMSFSRQLAAQGIGIAAVSMSASISGLMLCDDRFGVFVFVNAAESASRRRLSLAHEYGHVVMDRHRLALLSREQGRDALIELRADAFAKELLRTTSGPDGAAAVADDLNSRFLEIAIEAYRRDEISAGKLVEVSAMVGVAREETLRVVDALGLE